MTYRAFWGPVLLHRVMVSLLALAAVVLAFSQGFTLWTLDTEFPLSSTTAYSPLLLAVYGGGLALFFAWRLHDRPDGRVAGLFLAVFSLNLSLSLVPSQAPSSAQAAAYSISMIYLVVGLRFTMLFPREITRPDLQALRDEGVRPATRLRPFRPILRLQELLVSRPFVLWALASVLVGLWYVRTRDGAAPHYLPFPAATRSAVVDWIAWLLVTPLSLAVAGLGVAFLRCGYRLSNAEERRKILWIVLSVLCTVLLVVAVNSFNYLTIFTDIVIFRTLFTNTVGLVVPVSGFLLLTGFAGAVLYSGAFDVRPLIDKTVLYGLLGVVLLFLFGGIEFALSELVLERMGAPARASSWLAGGTVALAFGPLRKAFKKAVDHWLRDALPATVLADGRRRQVVIVFTDVVGFTKLASANEDDALTMLSVLHRVARKAASKRNGALVKTMGDGVLMEFKETGEAIGAVQALASSFEAALTPLGLPEVRLRTGVHFGLVATRRDGDLFGDAVNIASRIEGIAEPGQIVLSQTAADQLGDEIKLEDLGERTLKNVAEPVRCWTIEA